VSHGDPMFFTAASTTCAWRRVLPAPVASVFVVDRVASSRTAYPSTLPRMSDSSSLPIHPMCPG
jgi:hypothetical protein